MLRTPRVIFKCPHIKGGGEKAAAHLGNYVKYVSTHDGVEHVDPGKAKLPATDKQTKLVEQLLRDFPSSKGVFEYEDYQAAPTWGNALEFISLRREDAARLGYDNAERWRKLLSAHAMDMAKAMKIPDAQFRWYAAFQDESHHPHVHMVCYSADGKSGFLAKQGIADINPYRDADWDAGEPAHPAAYGGAGPAPPVLLR